MKPKTIKLGRLERVVAVVPAAASGAGWRNRPVWVYIEDGATGRIRSECLQPREQSKEMRSLYNIGDAVRRDLLSSVPTRKSKV